MKNRFHIFAAVFESGALAQLARALQWHCRGHRFESDMLHFNLYLLVD